MLGEYAWNYYSEGSEESHDVLTIVSTRESSKLSSFVDDAGDVPEFVSQYQDERAKRAAAVEEEKKERLRKLLGLDKIKARDSAATIITPESSFSSLNTSSSESSCNYCLKDIKVSDSQLKLLNIYIDYPVPDDPGLLSAFWTLYPRDKVYKEDGIQKFIDSVERMKLRPIKKICIMLQSEEIDLGFYGIDPRIVRPLCDAVRNNTSIQALNFQNGIDAMSTSIFDKYFGIYERWRIFCRDLLEDPKKDNPLSISACYHLSNLLINNQLLESLNLSGCRIGPRGAEKLIDGLSGSRSLEHLNLNKCELMDEGTAYVCDGLCDNTTILTLDLSDNNLSGEFAESLYDLFVQNETLEEINFSWNSLCTEEFWETFVQGLLKNISVKRIQLSWNSLGKRCLPFLIGLLNQSVNLTDLDLSNNRFDKEDAGKLSKALANNEILGYLSLRNNPIGAEGALALIISLTPDNSPLSRLQHLDLDNIWPNKDVIPFLSEIKKKRELTVKFGGILSNYKLIGPNPRKILLKRANFEAMMPKKKKLRRDFGQFVLSLDDGIASKIDFQQSVKRYKLKLSDSLVTEIMNSFEIDKNNIDQISLKKFYIEEYPDTKPPPPKSQKGKKDTKKNKKKNEGEEGNADNEVDKEKLMKKTVQLVEPPQE